jgi:hypothetical protein
MTNVYYLLVFISVCFLSIYLKYVIIGLCLAVVFVYWYAFLLLLCIPMLILKGFKHTKNKVKQMNKIFLTAIL